jgi:eukaryotic-like serine/threonine-protein kinase
MQLWNEYEGRIVADQFPLKKLLEPEGRSAFFSTTNGSGAPAVIRLIEAHFDEPEILSRWTAVAKVDQPNLIKLKKFGQTTLDETALLYAVMEPSDASLADILKERPLTTQEARQLATSLVPALEALHANNLVHEHLEAANVLAIGEVIKLRSDCIREAPEGAEGPEAKARDVRDLANVLLQALTLQRRFPVGTTLPAPFHEIVTNGLSGAWGLPQIAAALAPAEAPKQPARAVPSTPTASAKESKPYAEVATHISQPAPQSPSRIVSPVATQVESESEDQPRRILPWTTIVAVIVVALFIGWHFLHKSPAPIPTLATMPSQTSQTSTSPTVSAASAPTPSNSAASAAPSESAVPTTRARTQWRVVAYTYNHQSQAQDKVAQILSKHPALNPEVFAPKGHAPYLVTVGGSMDRDAAMAFRRKSRAEGLPRDTYAQNFPANAR